MKKYVYPAIFTQEDGGLYSVEFRDLESCYTCGDDIDDAVLNAQDVLSMVLYRYEKNGMAVPKPSNIANIEIDNKSFVSYVMGDTDIYRRNEKEQMAVTYVSKDKSSSFDKSTTIMQPDSRIVSNELYLNIHRSGNYVNNKINKDSI